MLVILVFLSLSDNVTNNCNHESKTLSRIFFSSTYALIFFAFKRFQFKFQG